MKIAFLHNKYYKVGGIDFWEMNFLENFSVEILKFNLFTEIF